VAQLYPQALGSPFVASYDSQGYGGGIRTDTSSVECKGLEGPTLSSQEHCEGTEENCCLVHEHCDFNFIVKF
jgi:hypothetical protein